MTEGTAGSLASINVVDLSRVLSGPYCTQVLADHGANVIKVEPPQGDETREWGPPFSDGLSAYYAGVNRNKRSIAIDLGNPGGRDVVLRLLKSADVLIHNFKPGAMEKWGLGYNAVLRERFPRLVFCHISGFGADGPLGSLPGYDAVVQAMTGMMSINGAPEGGPMRMGTPIVDIGSGLIACAAILAALVERSQSGIGQAIEVPLFDSALSLLHPHAANALMSNKVPVATGNAHPNIVPYDMFRTRTRPIYLSVGNNGQFAKLCGALGVPEIAKDPRFSDNRSRLQNRGELMTILSDRFLGMEAEELEPRLLSLGVPAGVVRTVTEALAHPHTAHRRMVASSGGYRGVGIPAAMSRTPGSVHRRPPAFGANSIEILRETGCSEEEIETMLSSGVVKQAAS